MSALKCPKCGVYMTESTHRGFPLDRCSSCKGYWFDHFALDSLLHKQLPVRWVGDSADLMNPTISCATDYPCPQCEDTLKSCERAAITIDWCPTCRGIFLDDDELERLAVWRRANLRREVKEIAKERAFEDHDPAGDLAFSALISDAFGHLFGGLFTRR